MNVLWISSLAWLKDGEYMKKVNGPGAVSGSLFQQSIIEGLEKNEINIDILSDYPASDRIVKGFKWSHNNISFDRTITSVNIPVISLIIKTICMMINIFNVKKTKKYDIAIGYLIHTPYLISLWLAKKINKNIKTVLICPDLPEYMDMSLKEKPIKSMLKNIDSWIINHTVKEIDSFIIFSEAMREKIEINDKPVIVIEGVYSSTNIDLTERNKKKAVMHAGTLHKNIGIENIIEAFKLIDDRELELWIFGGGELNNFIEDSCEVDKRIKFYGFVSREKLFEYEKQAMLLINARNPNDEYTKYSFPSKTFEYMVSGTPFLTTKLEGIPKEYYEYLYTMDDNNPITIANRIKEILKLNMKINDELGQRAREFIINEKDKKAQSEKIRSFLELLLQ